MEAVVIEVKNEADIKFWLNRSKKNRNEGKINQY